MCRWWRELGEEPSLWTGFKLHFTFHPDCNREEILFELLSLRRLQTLQYIHLYVFMSSWKTILQSLEIISDSQPPIKSLSMDVPLASLETSVTLSHLLFDQRELQVLSIMDGFGWSQIMGQRPCQPSSGHGQP